MSSLENIVYGAVLQDLHFHKGTTGTGIGIFMELHNFEGLATSIQLWVPFEHNHKDNKLESFVAALTDTFVFENPVTIEADSERGLVVTLHEQKDIEFRLSGAKWHEIA